MTTTRRCLIDRAQESISDVQRIVRPNAPVVDRFADREKNRHLDRAGGVKAPPGVDGETEAALVIEQRDRISDSVALAHDTVAGLAQRLAPLLFVHDNGLLFTTEMKGRKVGHAQRGHVDSTER